MQARKNLFLLSAGHFVVDAFAGFFPMLIAMRDLDLVKAGLIVTSGNMVSNLLQPVFGMMADRFRRGRLLFTGMVLGPLFMSLIGLTGDYAVLAFFVITGKCMISLYHPGATDMATLCAVEGRSPFRFSVFSFVGTAGFAFTGVYFQSFCNNFGLHRSYLMALPALLLALFIRGALPETPVSSRPLFLRGFLSALRQNRKAITVLYFLIVIQSSLQVVLVYALPALYRQWGFREGLWAIPHLLFTSAGAISVIVFGYLTKRFGPGRLIVGSMLADIPLWFLFLTTGMQGSPYSFLFVTLLGLSNFAALPAMVVLGQKKLPGFGATVSGILMGAAWGLAGIAPFLVSAFSEWVDWDLPGSGLVPGMLFMGGLPLVAILIWLLAGEREVTSPPGHKSRAGPPLRTPRRGGEGS